MMPFACSYSLCHDALRVSNASGIPPKPEYDRRTASSSSVAIRPLCSRSFAICTAARLRWNTARFPAVVVISAARSSRDRSTVCSCSPSAAPGASSSGIEDPGSAITSGSGKGCSAIGFSTPCSSAARLGSAVPSSVFSLVASSDAVSPIVSADSCTSASIVDSSTIEASSCSRRASAAGVPIHARAMSS